jgi:hypothetical protein
LAGVIEDSEDRIDAQEAADSPGYDFLGRNQNWTQRDYDGRQYAAQEIALPSAFQQRPNGDRDDVRHGNRPDETNKSVSHHRRQYTWSYGGLSLARLLATTSREYLMAESLPVEYVTTSSV